MVCLICESYCVPKIGRPLPVIYRLLLSCNNSQSQTVSSICHDQGSRALLDLFLNAEQRCSIGENYDANKAQSAGNELNGLQAFVSKDIGKGAR